MQAGYKNKIHDRVAVLYAAVRTLSSKKKRVYFLFDLGFVTVLGDFVLLLGASCAIKKQKKQRNDDI